MKSKKFILIIMSLFIFVYLLNYVLADNWVCYDSTGKVTESQLRAQFQKINLQPTSPLHIIDTNKKVVTYSVSPYFRDCGNNYTFRYCPENEYYLKTIVTTPGARCLQMEGAHDIFIGSNNLINGVDCGLGGGPHCTKFSTPSSYQEQYFVCGKDNYSWRTMTAPSNWICPTCYELAIRNKEEPYMGNLSTFKDLSLDKQLLISNTSVDFSFMVYILACLNRIPMINLNISLVDPTTNKVIHSEYGIYAKHETLDYNKENLGLLKDYKLPNQKEFKKTYLVKATMSGYRAWAWRKRLVDAIERIDSKKKLTVPGFPSSDSNQQKFGNLYYSSDFLTNRNTIGNPNLETTINVTKTQYGFTNVLKNLGYIDGYSMCTIYDLQNYISKYGLTSTLLNYLGKTINLLNDVKYIGVKANKEPDKVITTQFSNLIYETNDSDTAENLKDELDYYSYYNDNYDLYSILKNDLDIINDNQIYSKSKDIVSGWFDYSPNIGCSNYDYKFKNAGIKTFNYNLDVINKSYYTYENETRYITKTINVTTTKYCHNDLDEFCKGIPPDTDKYNSVCPYDLYSNDKYKILNKNTICNYNKKKDLITYNETTQKQVTVKENYTEKILHENYTYKFDFSNTIFDSIWINDILADIDLIYNQSVSSYYSWNFATMEELPPIDLAKCLYNFSRCLLSSRPDGSKTYQEGADCGMGPPSDLADHSMKDGARGKRTIEQNITVYKKCVDGKNWISENGIYACVNGDYYKCNFALGSYTELLLGVRKINLGQTILLNQNGTRAYVCISPGIFKEIGCSN